MTETPRDYKKRIDEKWKKNGENRDKLIQQIERYELVDEGFKTRTKQEILSNFKKNERAEKESEQYKVIISELENIDKKYIELEELKEKLKMKIQEKVQVDKEIRGYKLDGSDETTLKIQMASVRKFKERLKILNSEIEELKNDIKNRKKEIKEIEETYGEKQDTVISNLGGIQDEKYADSNEFILTVKMTDKKPSTLKEYHEQTVQDLWNKDRIRGKIFEILEEGAGIDDKLKDKIEKEISDRFYNYYDKKRGSLRLKSAKYLKNKLRNRKEIYSEIKKMPEGSEKEEKLDGLERLENAYGVNTSRELELIKKENAKLSITATCGKFCGKDLLKVKDENGNCYIYRGDTRCCDSYKEIGEIQEIGGKPVFKIRNGDGKYAVYRGDVRCGDWYKNIGKIQEIGGKPVFVTKDDNSYKYPKVSCSVIWGNKVCCGGYNYNGKCCGYKKIGKIYDIGGTPVFTAKTFYYPNDINVYRGDKLIKGYTNLYGIHDHAIDDFSRVLTIKEIGGKPFFILKRWNEGGCYAFRGDRQYFRYICKITEVKDIGGEPAFLAQNAVGRWYVVKGYNIEEFSGYYG